MKRMMIFAMLTLMGCAKPKPHYQVYFAISGGFSSVETTEVSGLVDPCPPGTYGVVTVIPAHGQATITTDMLQDKAGSLPCYVKEN